MVNCAVSGCYNHSKKCNKLGHNIKFYRFPKDVELCYKWIQACGRPTIDLNMASICSVHFQPSVFLNPLRFQIMKSVPKNFRNIKDDAVPTENLPVSFYETKIIAKGKKSFSKRKGVKEKRYRSPEISDCDNVCDMKSPDDDKKSSLEASPVTTTPAPTVTIEKDSNMDLDHLEIFVATMQEDKVWAVKEAFKTVFGKAKVIGVPTANPTNATQPIGFSAALTQAKDKIAQVRSSVADKTQHCLPVLAIEHFTIRSEIEKWYEMSLLVLSHPSQNINLQSLTQCTPVPGNTLTEALNNIAQHYTHVDTGYNNTIDQNTPQKIQSSSTRRKQSAQRVTQRDLTLIATRSLADMYKNILHTKSKHK